MKFTKPFIGVKKGEIYPTEFNVGEECPEDLEEAAKALGAVEDGDVEQLEEVEVEEVEEKQTKKSKK